MLSEDMRAPLNRKVALLLVALLLLCSCSALGEVADAATRHTEADGILSSKAGGTSNMGTTLGKRSTIGLGKQTTLRPTTLPSAASTADGCTSSHFSPTGSTDATWVECLGGKAARIAYLPKDALLDGLQGKWLYFIGDSATRGMVLSLLRHLDPLSSMWVNTTRDFNATLDEHAGFFCSGQKRSTASWQSMGGDMLRGDYIFEKRGGTAARDPDQSWAVAYKKQSQICSSALCPYFKRCPVQPPLVFQDGNAMWEDRVLHPSPKRPAVRVSFHNAIGTADIARILNATSGHQDAVVGQPDVIYTNVGAWGSSTCDTRLLEEVILSHPTAQFVWGTSPKLWTSCDKKILSHFSNLSACSNTDRSTVSSTRTLASSSPPSPQCFVDRAETIRELKKAAGERFFADSVTLGGVHVTYGASTHDYMRLLSYLIPAPPSSSRKRLVFNETCWMTEKRVVSIFGKEGVPWNYQGWKTPWKLACDFKWVNVESAI